MFFMILFFKMKMQVSINHQESIGNKNFIQDTSVKVRLTKIISYAVLTVNLHIWLFKWLIMF
ncbi:hypothetical protein C7K70_01330 [Aeromonas hydrophila]|nr:hypothetical protein C7K70_01330 [Aeromonas hydrophila]